MINSTRTLSPNPKCVSSSEHTLETSDRCSSFLNPSSLAGAIVEKDTEIAREIQGRKKDKRYEDLYNKNSVSLGLLAMAHKIRAMLYAAGPRPFSIPNVYAIIKEFISTNFHWVKNFFFFFF